MRVFFVRIDKDEMEKAQFKQIEREWVMNDKME